MEAKDIKNTKRFELYLEGKMTASERQKFEQALEADEELRLSFQLHQAIINKLDGELKEDILAINRIGAEQEKYKIERHQLFEKYYNGKLSDAEKIKFEQRLQNEMMLSIEWESFEKAQGEKKLVALHRRKRIFRNLVAMAAAILLLIVGYWSFERFTSSPYDELVASNYELPENYITGDNDLVIKGTTEEITNDLLTKGFEAYDTAKFDEAARLLSQYVKIKGTTDTANIVQLYIGTSYYEQGQYKKAIKAYEQGSKNMADNSEYRGIRDIIQWQLALTYLKINQKEKAISLLEYLAQNADYIIVEKDAKALLEQLESL